MKWRLLMSRSTGKCGFTLAEILIVLAILAMLASFLASATMRTRERASRTVCSSNLRQLLMAAKMYEGDNDILPIHYNANAFGQAAHWQEQVWPYIRNRRTYLCPHDSTGGLGLTTEGGWPVSYNYCISYFWLNPDNSFRPPKPRSPLFIDNHHMTANGAPGEFVPGAVILIGRYDGSIEAAPIFRYPVLGYEPEDGLGQLR
jgi:prepilin-type N-terminal cleavage/methylation domain-containing protein